MFNSLLISAPCHGPSLKDVFTSRLHGNEMFRHPSELRDQNPPTAAEAEQRFKRQSGDKKKGENLDLRTTEFTVERSC